MRTVPIHLYLVQCSVVVVLSGDFNVVNSRIVRNKTKRGHRYLPNIWNNTFADIEVFDSHVIRNIRDMLIIFTSSLLSTYFFHMG